jgi:hypothetical protein
MYRQWASINHGDSGILPRSDKAFYAFEYCGIIRKLNSIKISDQTNVMLDWVIYFPLLYNLIVPMYDVDTITPVQNADDTFETHLDALEVTSFVESSDSIIWRDVGRLIWWKLLLEGVPH